MLPFTSHAQDACTYIGARLAKTHSVCKEMFCSGIVRSAVPARIAPSRPLLGPGDSVSCSEAEQLVALIEVKTADIDDDLPSSYMATIVHEGLKPLALTRMDLPYFVEATMQDLLRYPKNAIQEHLISNLPEVNRYMEIIWKGILVDPHARDAHTDLLSSALHFWFDLAGMFPDLVPLPSSEELAEVTVQTLSKPVSHRPRLPWETVLTVTEWLGPPEIILEYVKSIEKIAENANLGSFELKQTDWAVIESLLANPFRDSSASVAMLRYIIRQKFCPFVEHVADMLLGNGERSAVKSGVSLVRECFGIASPFQLKLASVILGHLGSGVPPDRYLELRNDESLIDQIANPELDWISGFQPEHADKAFTIVHALFSLEAGYLRPICPTVSAMFVPEIEYSEAVEYKAFTRGVGRVIGLALRSGISLKFLQLHPIIVKALKDPSCAVEISGTDLDRAPFDLAYGITLAEILNTVHLVRDGIRDSFGPAVFEAFSDTEFYNFFLV